MFPIAAAALAGGALAKAAHNADVKSPAHQLQEEQFKKLMLRASEADKSKVSLQDLLAKAGPQLQNAIKSMSYEEQLLLARELFGAEVTVQDQAGHQVTGLVTAHQANGGMPMIEVGGIMLSMDRLTAIHQLGTLYQG